MILYFPLIIASLLSTSGVKGCFIFPKACGGGPEPNPAPTPTLDLGSLTTDPTGYVEYYEGKLPIVITVPHGGYLEPTEIPDRTCPVFDFYCRTVRDRYTQEISRDVASALHSLTGCHAHLVVSLLHREKLDCNRPLEDAAQHPIAEQAWGSFHSAIETAKNSFSSARPGLVVDMHGHSHIIERIELGYLITSRQTQLSDADLDKRFAEGTIDASVRSLAEANPTPLSEIIRGDNSLGDLLWENGGYRSIPSPPDPSIDGGLLMEPYLTGGYITERHGSVNGGNVDAIQIEMNQNLRVNTEARAKFADDLATALVEFMEKWYLAPGEALCGMTGVE